MVDGGNTICSEKKNALVVFELGEEDGDEFIAGE